MRDSNRCPVVDTSRSPQSLLKPVSVGSVTLNDLFWAPRIEMNRSITIPLQYQQCEATGRIDNFRRASGRKPGDFQGIFFNDSDVYKWIEAAAYSIASKPDANLDTTLDGVIDDIAAAQDRSGYLNTYYTFERERERWTNLRDMHEMYCAGHLLQGAVAHHRATGKRSLLEVACRLADHVDDQFGPQGRPGACGHEEMEMALVELYRETGESRYLHLASRMIDARGRHPSVAGGDAYHQDHVPFRDLAEMTGHAVRAVYLDCGATDVFAETGDASLLFALERQWANMMTTRIYVTGGIGSRWDGEAFGADYELPNDRAYTETCAAIGSIMWNWRMLSIAGDARHSDLIETTLYNAVLPGLSLDGKQYFYQNPLADAGGHRRQEWFGCACCPPNIARLMASLPGYFYSVSDGAVWAHLYASGKVVLNVPGAGQVELIQETEYPWSGDVCLTITESPSVEWTLLLRVPGWCRAADLRVNGKETGVRLEPGKYAAVRRIWRPGDRVDLGLAMPVRMIESHPFLSANHRQVALARGPLIYCVEAADHPDVDVRVLEISQNARFTSRFQPGVLDGVVMLRSDVFAVETGAWSHSLYRNVHEAGGSATTGDTTATRPVIGSLPIRPQISPARLVAIPYYAWANRQPGSMRVWIPLIP